MVMMVAMATKPNPRAEFKALLISMVVPPFFVVFFASIFYRGMAT